MFLKAVMKQSFPMYKPIRGWVCRDYPQSESSIVRWMWTKSSADIFLWFCTEDSSKISGLIQAPTLPFTPCIAHAFEQTNVISAIGLVVRTV